MATTTKLFWLLYSKKLLVCYSRELVYSTLEGLYSIVTRSLKLFWEKGEGINGVNRVEGSKEPDLDRVNLEWTLQVGGTEPDQCLYILELKAR